MAGLRALRDAPLAVAPFAVEGTVAGILVLVGAFPADGASAASTAAFPLDVYFDVKQALAHGRGWPWFVAAGGFSVLVRGGVLALSLWLLDARRDSLAIVWVRSLRLAALAALAFVPSAALFFTGVAVRYAPFVWVAAAVGFAPAVWLARRAAALDAGTGAPAGKGVPEIGTFLGYAFVVTALAAAMSVLGGTSRWAVALLLACSGPLHALYLLGWRTHLREETYPAGGSVAVALTITGVVAFAGASLYDRYVRETPPVARARGDGTLALLGGADSTSDTGALTEIDPRDFGFDAGNTVLLSYTRSGPYSAADTHRDLDAVAEVVAEQLRTLEGPVFVLGHSQAAGILDRMPPDAAPAAAVVISPPPASSPPVDVPAPGERGPGKPGGDAARAVADLLGAVGFGGFDVDAAAAPVHLRPAEDTNGAARRLAVWALGDSAWLQGDWRRDGELNLVAISDHVGATNDSRAVSATRRFFAGLPVRSDSASWRGALAAALRYAFEPWRPG